MLRHEPDRELPTHADALRTTAAELSAVDLKLPPMTERLGGLLATFRPPSTPMCARRRRRAPSTPSWRRCTRWRARRSRGGTR